MFPDDRIGGKNINWQPISVHTEPLSTDYLLASQKRCDRFDYLMIEYMNETVYPVLSTEYKSLISFLEEQSGTELTTLTSINNLYDTLLIEQLNGKA